MQMDPFMRLVHPKQTITVRDVSEVNKSDVTRWLQSPIASLRAQLPTMVASTFASLLDENRKLRAQLKSFDEARRRTEQQVAELRGRLHQAEVAAAQQLRRKEAQWMAEYDRGVQALLKIVQHHEGETVQLKLEVDKLRAAAAVVPPSITKMTRAAQTESARPHTRNSVRFESNEDCAASHKEESEYIDPKTKIHIARMQHLFEQLQLSRDHRDDKMENLSLKRGRKGEHVEHEPRRSIKEEIVTRLEAHQKDTDAVQRPEDNKSKTTETQTEGISVSISSTKLQQDLEERNRLLHERLTSQQNMLDQWLHTKLTHANANSENRERGPLQNAPQVQGCSDKDQSEASNKSEHPVPMVDPPGCLAPNVAVHIEPIRTIERRPLSPPAA
ncbi:hypothetical protein PF008_g14134 [Phytophthora fragariae]|uniref:Uncharacterized protein n=1 Tax=Phytophthora fragariae TaxID=53985 RepID=A0A6G0RI15_9STRA|nr:hypothetical protein PF008_g14134 [Phytophthora fragariae]